MRRSWQVCLTCALILAISRLMAANPNTQANGTAEAGVPFPQEWSAKLAVAESVIAREEAASERAFDPSFRAKTRDLLAALPMAALQSQTQENGLGLNSLGDSQADLVYTPLTPCRIVDTRLAGGVIGAGATRNFLVTGTDLSSQGGSATGCGVPFGPATAAVINFVAVTPGGTGNLRVTPFGTAIPLASIINYAAGLTIANGPAVAMCDPSSTTCTNDITIQANASATHLVADVQGYFRRVGTGGVGTALLADGAVTAAKIGSGVAVRSLNTQTDTVTLAGANGLSVSQGAGTVTVASNATPANTASTIVSRDGSGSFSAGSVGLTGSLNLRATTLSGGVIRLGDLPFLHGFGTGNTFLGATAGNMVMSGGSNTGVGTKALLSNSTGAGNSALGYQALRANTLGTANSAVGASALESNWDGWGNSAFGWQALQANANGYGNSAVGYRALWANTASYNSAFGYGALQANIAGYSNSAFGKIALWQNTSGYTNSAFGEAALRSNGTGYANSAFGSRALESNSTGAANTAVGNDSLYALATGNNNLALGQFAGASLTSGSDNIYIAHNGAATESGVIRIGTSSNTATFIAGIWGRTSAAGTGVLVNSAGQLGVTVSSVRFKDEIRDMDEESDVLMKMRPVAFYYKPELDDTHTRQYGLVAEEVAEVAPRLVVFDEGGAPQAVRYHFVNAMLLNEVQKQRRLVEEQRTTVGAQESKIQDLEARLARLEAALAGDR